MRDNASKSKVFFIPWREKDRLHDLIERSGLPEFVKTGDFVAVKIHFGEKGSDGFIKPDLVRPVLDAIRGRKGRPFLTDANTIYHGSRSDAVSHLLVAAEHGFSQTRLGAPLIIADGLTGGDFEMVEVSGRHFSRVKIASSIMKADAMIALSHFKGHLLTGFGGAIKNLGMGCAARPGKFEMHSTAKPTVKTNLCTGCAACIARCSHHALSLESGVIRFDESACTGCGDCIIVCKGGALTLTWNEGAASVQEKMAEYAVGAIKGRRTFCINFVNHITANCDCMGMKEEPLMPDVGILASADPVAIDKASLDLVVESGGDVFKEANPNADYNVQLRHAKGLGLGRLEYELISV